MPESKYSPEPHVDKTLTLRMQLNTFFSGPQAWFFLAVERGYLEQEGLHIDFVEGDTAANTVPKMAAGGFDIGYGDINAQIEHAGRRKPNAPLAVYASYNASPYTIAVAADGPLRAPQDLAGKRLVTHPNDAAWLLFPEFCRMTGLREADVSIDTSPAPHSALIPRLLAGEFDALFGFVNTLAAAAIDAGVDPQALHTLDYNRHVPDLYGMALMVTRELAQSRPDAVRGLLRGLNRGLVDTIADPHAAIAALSRQGLRHSQEANLQRLTRTLQLEMAHPEGGRLGIGDLDSARFDRGIALIATTKHLPHHPRADELFSGAFLPPLEERVRSLAHPD